MLASAYVNKYHHTFYCRPTLGCSPVVSIPKLPGSNVDFNLLNGQDMIFTLQTYNRG